MKSIIFFTIIIFNVNILYATELLNYLENAYNKNPVLNASRENYKATKENINISRSDFLPSISASNSQSSQQNSKRTNQAGVKLPDNSNTTNTQSVSVDQKIFQGFHGYNSIKKSELESEQASLKLKDVEQKILLQSATAFTER